MEKLEPDTLALSIGGYSRPSWKVAWKKPQLVYCHFDAEYELRAEEKLTPSPEEWRRFWDRLEECGIWGWDAYYFANAEEPASWTLEILHKDGRYIDTGGSSSFPGLAEAGARRVAGRSGASPEGTSDTDPPPDAFSRFLDALRELVGGRELFPFDPGELQGEIPRAEIDRIVPPPEPARSRARRSGDGSDGGDGGDGGDGEGGSRRGLRRRRKRGERDPAPREGARSGRGGDAGGKRRGGRRRGPGPASAPADGTAAAGGGEERRSAGRDEAGGPGGGGGGKRGRRGRGRRGGGRAPSGAGAPGDPSPPADGASRDDGGGPPRRRRRGRRGGRRGPKGGGDSTPPPA